MSAVRVELGRLVAVRAGHAGPFIAVFFCASRCSTALAAILSRDGADLELVVAEDVGIVRGGEVGSEFADLGVDGLTDGSGEVIDFSLLLGW